MCHWGGGGRPPPGRPLLIGRMQSRGAGPRARGGGSAQFWSQESGLGFRRESPAVAAAADPSARPAARPGSPGPASSSAKSRSERRQSAREVVGLGAGAGQGEVCPGTWILAPLLPRAEQPVHPGGELTLWKEKSNCSLPKDVKLRRPAGSRRAFASARRAEPRRAAPRRTAEPSRASRLGAGRRPRGSGP